MPVCACVCAHLCAFSAPSSVRTPPGSLTPSQAPHLSLFSPPSSASPPQKEAGTRQPRPCDLRQGTSPLRAAAVKWDVWLCPPREVVVHGARGLYLMHTSPQCTWVPPQPSSLHPLLPSPLFSSFPPLFCASISPFVKWGQCYLSPRPVGRVRKDVLKQGRDPHRPKVPGVHTHKLLSRRGRGVGLCVCELFVLICSGPQNGLGHRYTSTSTKPPPK